MKSRRLLPACGAVLLASAWAQEPVPAPVPESDGFEERRQSRKLTGMRERLAGLDALLPDGSQHLGVRYPMYRPFQPRDVSGVVELETEGVPAAVESIFTGETVRRLDPGHLSFTGAVFEEHGDETAPRDVTRTLRLVRAVYDTVMDLIVSDRRVVIEEKTRRIEAGGMLHDHASGLTHFTGGVTMTIYDEPEASADAAAAAAPPEGPAPPAAAPAGTDPDNPPR